jgi:hypothetical protein
VTAEVDRAVQVHLEPAPGDVVVLLPATALQAIWRRLLEVQLAGARDGVGLRPDVARAMENLRAAASTPFAMSARGRDSRTSADIGAASEHAPTPTAPASMSTQQAGDRLGVGTRHMRRIATAAGVVPIGRDCWSADDIAALAATRRRAR